MADGLDTYIFKQVILDTTKALDVIKNGSNTVRYLFPIAPIGIEFKEIDVYIKTSFVLASIKPGELTPELSSFLRFSLENVVSSPINGLTNTAGYVYTVDDALPESELLHLTPVEKNTWRKVVAMPTVWYLVIESHRTINELSENYDLFSHLNFQIGFDLKIGVFP